MKPIQNKLKEAQFGPEQIRKQHADKEKSLAKKVNQEPSMVKYNPAPLEFDTFTRMTLFPKDYKEKKVFKILISRMAGVQKSEY
jgi:hypothetical protein